MKHLIVILTIAVLSGCIYSPSTVPLPDDEPTKKVHTSDEIEKIGYQKSRQKLEYNPALHTTYDPKIHLSIEYQIQLEDSSWVPAREEVVKAFFMFMGNAEVDIELIEKYYPTYIRIRAIIERYKED